MTESLHVEWQNSEESVSTSVTNYITMGGSTVETDSSNAGTERAVRDAGTARNMAVFVGTNNISAASNFGLQVSQVAGNLDVVITASTANTYFEDTSNSDTIAATDELAYEIATGATGSSLGLRLAALEFDATSDCVTLMGCNNAGSSNDNVASTTRFYPLFGGRSANTTESFPAYEMRGGGTLSDLGLRTGTVTRTTDTTMRSRVNAGNGNMSIATQASNTWHEDTSNTDAIVQGDDINVSNTTGTGTGNFNIEKITASFVSTSGQSFAAVHGNDERINDNLTRFWPVRGSMAEEATESETQATIRYNCTSRELTANMTRITGGVTATYRTRINSGNGNQNVVLTAVSTGTDTSNTDTITAGDSINNQVSSPAGGTNYDTQYIGVIHEVSVAAAGAMTLQSPMRYHRHNLTR